MNRHISYFTQTLVELKIKIQPPINYPFNPAIWSLIESKSITCCNLDVREHFEYLISVHNYKYTLSWSAAIHFEKDLLVFMSSIKPALEYL